MANSIRFEIQRRVTELDQLEFVPVIDGTRLTDRIHSFELAAGMETRQRSYGGLIPAFFRAGSARDHYFGTTADEDDGRVVLLGCNDCGEWGCWPLTAELAVGNEIVTWRAFRQPHRPARDYGAFGPFVFHRSAYADAVASIAAAWEQTSSRERKPH